MDLRAGSPDVHVVGYAVDGRPEPKITQPVKPSKTKTVEEVAARFAEKDSAYDDYDVQSDNDGDEFAELADASVAAAKRIARGIRRRVKSAAAALKERIRHSDRP